MREEKPDHSANNSQQKKSTEKARRLEIWLNQASEEDIRVHLQRWEHHYRQQADIIHPEDAPLIASIESKLDSLDNCENKPIRVLRLFRACLKVAAVLACLVLGTFFIIRRDPKKHIENVTALEAIRPGSNQATLMLSDGSTIILESALPGLLAKQGHVIINKPKAGQLVYNSLNSQPGGKKQFEFNTITTPKGGQYQVVLPDGSKVWLNAASSIKFPTYFSGKTREVVLNGEAYFEVSHDKVRPFVVAVNGSKIQVYGTHFNVMSYADEGVTKTTLLEGSVKVIKGRNERMLSPGQQACVGDDINVSRVNAVEAIEWKNGNLNFSNEKLPGIMRKIARWYNVDIQYQGKITDEVFVGTIPRSQSIDEALKYLELTELVHFKIEGRRIIVTK